MKSILKRISHLALLLLVFIIIYSCKKDATVPGLTTFGISNATQTTAISGGDITSDGGATVSARGVCWNTSSNPTIDNNRTSDGSGAGVFSSSITGLTQGTTYYVRAYATNSVGTAYGNQIIFTATAAMPTAGLIGYWPFSGNANDMSGNNNNGVVYGATLTTDRFGNANSAYYFDGVSSYILIANSTSLNPTSAISLCAWYNPVDFTGGGFTGIIEKDYTSYASPYYQYKLGTTGYSANEFAVNINVNDTLKGATTPSNYYTIDNWYFLVATYDGTTLKLFVNNVLIQSTPVTGLIASYNSSLNFGRNSTVSDFLKGTVDDIRMYNRALSATEVQTLYHEGGYK